MAIRFDAATDRLVRTSGLLNYNAAYTRMAWVYAVSGAGGTSYMDVFASLANASDYMPGLDELAFGDVAGGPFSISVWNGSWSGSDGSTATQNGTWYHVALVRESASLLRLYVNGTSEATVSANVSGRGASVREEIGAMSTNNYNPLNGRIAAIKEYSAALAQDEIRQEMRQYLPGRTASLWKFTPGVERSVSDAILDYSGNGRNWTQGGTLSLEDGPPIPWAQGRARVFIPAGAGGNVYDETVSFTANSGVASQSQSDLIGALSLGSIGGIAPTASLVIEEALSLGSVGGMDHGESLDVFAALSLAAAGSIGASGALTIEAISTFAAQSGLSVDAAAQLIGALSISIASAVATSTGSTFQESLSFTAVSGINAGASADLAAALSLQAMGGLTLACVGELAEFLSIQATAGVTSAAVASLIAAITPGVVASMAASYGDGAVINEQMSIGSVAALSALSTQVANATTALGAQMGVTPGAILEAVSMVGFDARLSAAISSVMEMSASLSVLQALGISASDMAHSIILTHQTYVVPADDRAFTVPADSRSFTVPADQRVFYA